jgi:catechol 2,3-dioxygenase
MRKKKILAGIGFKKPDEVRIDDNIPPIGGLWTTGNLSHDIAIFTDPNIEPMKQY